MEWFALAEEYLGKDARNNDRAGRSADKAGNEGFGQKMLKQKLVSEDQERKAQDDVQKLTDKYIKEVDTVMVAKEKEIMEV